MSTENQKEQQLAVAVEGDRMMISIGVDLLVHAVTHGPYFQGFDDEECVVTDKKVFVQSIAKALLFEEEDGTTPLHRAFDEAAESVCENGEPGIEFFNEDEEEE